MKIAETIDGNYLMFKNAFIMKGVKADDEISENDGNKISFESYSNLLYNDFKRIINLYNFDVIFFVYEKGSSWRKDIYKDYKGNRKKDESIDWNEIYRRFDMFLQQAQIDYPNIHFIQIDKCEGDDLILYLTLLLNNKNYSNVIISKDEDLTQLLKFESGLYLNVQLTMNKADERIYLPLNYNYFLNNLNIHKKDYFDMTDDEIFDLDYNNNNGYKGFIDKMISKCKLYEILPNNIRAFKIIHGDTGDNVKSVYIKKTVKDDVEKFRGIGEAGAEKILKYYIETYGNISDVNSEDFINKIVNVVSYDKKIVDDETKALIKENTIRNRQLVVLDPIYTPEYVKNNIKVKMKEINKFI